MMRVLIVLVVLFGAGAANATCVCLKCLLGQHKMFVMNGDAMAPALRSGECAIARYIFSDETPPERGDVVYFQHPILDAIFVFRVIGLAGDTVQIKDGVLWLNDHPVEQTLMSDFEQVFERGGPLGTLPNCQNQPAIGEVCKTQRFLETLPNGKSYQTLNIRETRIDNTVEFIVPNGHAFVLGDHRDNAIDSRFSQSNAGQSGIGMVPLENIYGIFDGY